jgi:hypothetical protein
MGRSTVPVCRSQAGEDRFAVSMSVHPGRAEIADGPAFRCFVAGLPDSDCRNGLFALCLPPIVYSRHHWLRYKGEYRVRADLRGFFEELRETDPSAWDDDQADFLLTLYALSLANVGLDELRDRVDTAAVRETLEGRFDLYATVAENGEVAGERPRTLTALAERVAAMRTVAERTHHLFSIIDGEAWYRTEGLIPRADVDEDAVSETVEEVLALDFGVPAGPRAEQRLRQAARDCIAEHGESAPLLRAIMAATLRDEVLRADHVTLTCPMGDLLETPEQMTTSQAFFTETQLREGIDLGAYAERLGHDSADQLQRTIRARMLKLKRGAIRSLYGPGCMQGRFVEKHGGHMLYLNEDAHYRGHQSIGVHSGGRASFALRYRSGGEERELTPMVGDYRVVRMSHQPEDVFTPGDLARVLRYGSWFRAVVEETYRQGGVLRRDEPADAEPVAIAAA